jgi:hypothetical protein
VGSAAGPQLRGGPARRMQHPDRQRRRFPVTKPRFARQPGPRAGLILTRAWFWLIPLPTRLVRWPRRLKTHRLSIWVRHRPRTPGGVADVAWSVTNRGSRRWAGPNPWTATVRRPDSIPSKAWAGTDLLPTGPSSPASPRRTRVLSRRTGQWPALAPRLGLRERRTQASPPGRDNGLRGRHDSAGAGATHPWPARIDARGPLSCGRRDGMIPA